MASLGTITWLGKSGKSYKYEIWSLSEIHKAVPANYIFVKETEADRYQPIYIGQTGDISERFDNHHKMSCIRKNGATHLCSHGSSSDEKERKAEESDLLGKWNTPCNDQ